MNYEKVNEWILHRCYGSGVAICLHDGNKSAIISNEVFFNMPSTELLIRADRFGIGSDGLYKSIIEGLDYSETATFHGDMIVSKIGNKRYTLNKLYNGSTFRFVSEKLIKLFEDKTRVQEFRFSDDIIKYPIIYILEDNVVIGGILPVKYNEV